MTDKKKIEGIRKDQGDDYTEGDYSGSFACSEAMDSPEAQDAQRKIFKKIASSSSPETGGNPDEIGEKLAVHQDDFLKRSTKLGEDNECTGDECDSEDVHSRQWL